MRTRKSSAFALRAQQLAPQHHRRLPQSPATHATALVTTPHTALAHVCMPLQPHRILPCSPFLSPSHAHQFHRAQIIHSHSHRRTHTQSPLLPHRERRVLLLHEQRGVPSTCLRVPTRLFEVWSSSSSLQMHMALDMSTHKPFAPLSSFQRLCNYCVSIPTRCSHST